MSDLTEFLLARIAEDEEAASSPDAHIPGMPQQRWRVEGDHPDQVVQVVPWVIGGRGGPAVARTTNFWHAAHIARWHPIRVRAECEVKRRLVEREAGGRTRRDDAPEQHEVHTWSDGGGHVMVGGERLTAAEYNERFIAPGAPSEVLRLLALPYADHPNYREEWQP